MTFKDSPLFSSSPLTDHAYRRADGGEPIARAPQLTGYRKIVDELASLIHKRVLCPGDRVPSVRSAARSHQVNPSTILRAYFELEIRGLIESRPRSGYFVRSVPLRQIPRPLPSAPAPHATAVVVDDVMVELAHAVNRPHHISLGFCRLNPELLPSEDLNRMAARVVRRLDPSRVNRDLTPGDPELRRLIALRYLDAGCVVPAEEIVITSGGREGIVLALRALTHPGDTVAIETPSEWPQFAGLAALGLRVQEISTEGETGIDLVALEEALQSRSIKACLVTPTFQNPLGSRMPDENRRALANLVAHYGVPLIENDPVPELYFEGARPRPVKALDGAGEVLHCGSFAACVAPAYKIGWIAAGRYRASVERTQMLLSQGAAAACQAVIAEYLAHGAVERNFRRLRESLSARRDAMVMAIADHFPDGCRMTQPTGGSLLWIELPQGTDSLKLYQRAHQIGVSVAPGLMFSARQEYGNCLRLNYGFASVEQIHDGIRRIAALIPWASPRPRPLESVR